MLTFRIDLIHVVCLLVVVLPLQCSGYEAFDTYWPYPDEAIGLLNKTVQDLASKAPKVEILITFPGKHDPFAHIQELAVRNSYQNPLFHLTANYMLGDGLDYGCREPNNAAAAAANTNSSDDRITDHSPSDEHPEMCKNHCTHQGRYCPPFNQDQLKEQTTHSGHDIVMETLRRLCLGDVLEMGYSSHLFFEYLLGFSKKKCMQDGRDLTQCSHQVLATKLPDFQLGPDSPFGKCLMEVDVDQDKTNHRLERALDISHQQLKLHPLDQMPIIFFNSNKFLEAHPRADNLMYYWCGFFGKEKPVACDFCRRCNNAKTCLWKLSCDEAMFNIHTYKDPKHPNKHNGVEDNNNNNNNPTTSAASNEVASEMKQVGTDVAKGTGAVLVGGIAIGLVIVAFLWCMVELKRKRAVAEVAKELPLDGFRDSTTFAADAATDVELPEVS